MNPRSSSDFPEYLSHSAISGRFKVLSVKHLRRRNLDRTLGISRRNDFNRRKLCATNAVGVNTVAVDESVFRHTPQRLASCLHQSLRSLFNREISLPVTASIGPVGSFVTGPLRFSVRVNSAVLPRTSPSVAGLRNRRCGSNQQHFVHIPVSFVSDPSQACRLIAPLNAFVTTFRTMDVSISTGSRTSIA